MPQRSRPDPGGSRSRSDRRTSGSQALQRPWIRPQDPVARFGGADRYQYRPRWPFPREVALPDVPRHTARIPATSGLRLPRPHTRPPPKARVARAESEHAQLGLNRHGFAHARLLPERDIGLQVLHHAGPLLRIERLRAIADRLFRLRVYFHDHPIRADSYR